VAGWLDSGGTSTDVALIQGGESRLAREAVVHPRAKGRSV
jgi:N-methylhydantoinase A/oxoprolinase/acetone carboxylase beta subunit